MAKHKIIMNNVSAQIADKAILNKISLRVDDQEHIGIIGPSGSGKSSLIRTINGLLPISSGTIEIDSQTITASQPSADCSKIGMVFQDYALFPHLTVLENLTLSPTLRNENSTRDIKDRAFSLLDKVKMNGFGNRFPASLSGGQQQRIAIARCLMTEPEILLLDEPTSALDPEMIHEVKSVLEGLMQSQLSIIIVSHDISFIKTTTNRVIFMDEGKKLSDQATDLFFTQPENERQISFIQQLDH